MDYNGTLVTHANTFENPPPENTYNQFTFTFGSKTVELGLTCVAPVAVMNGHVACDIALGRFSSHKCVIETHREIGIEHGAATCDRLTFVSKRKQSSNFEHGMRRGPPPRLHSLRLRYDHWNTRWFSSKVPICRIHLHGRMV